MYRLTVDELKACQKATGCNIWMNKSIPCLSFQVLLLLCKQSLSLPQQRRTKVPTKDSIKVHKRFQKAGPKGKKLISSENVIICTDNNIASFLGKSGNLHKSGKYTYDKMVPATTIFYYYIAPMCSYIFSHFMLLQSTTE